MNALNWIQGSASDDALEAAKEARKAAYLEGDEGHNEDAHDGAPIPAARLESQHARRFMLAGNARLTLVSQKTSARFTFRIVKKDTVHFVSVLTGSNNDADYTFLGTIFDGTRFVHGRKSRISPDAPSAKAFAWASRHLLAGNAPPACEVHHEGRCGKCNRPLTVPESIVTGLGPICADR